jgi:hypothetical protein
LRSEAINVLVSKLRVVLNPTYIISSELVQLLPTGKHCQVRVCRITAVFPDFFFGTTNHGSCPDDFFSVGRDVLFQLHLCSSFAALYA